MGVQEGQSNPIDQPSLRIEIKNREPIELEDLSASLKGFGDEYRRWLSDHDRTAASRDVRLYVQRIESGSIIADMMALAPPGALVFAENANTVIGFCAYLKSVYGWLSGGAAKPAGLTKQNLINASSILEPVAKDGGSQLNIGTLNVNAPITVTINSTEANAMQNRAGWEIARLNEPQSSVHSKVVLYWYQARNDQFATTGDKAIIESIYPGPVKVVFVNDSDKARILREAENPFTRAYVVDVTVETISGRPALYRVLQVHDSLEIPPAT